MNKYYDEYIKHLISLEYYGNYLVGLTKNELLDLEEEIEDVILGEGYFPTKSRYNSALSQVREITSTRISGINDMLLTQMLLSAEKEGRWITDFTGRHLNVSLKVPANISSVVEFTPYAEAGSVQDFVDNLQNKVFRTYKNGLKAGYLTGISGKDIISNLENKKRTILRGVEADVSTIGSGVPKAVDKSVFLAAKNIVTEYVWCSILDSSTCLVCGSLHNQRFKGITNIPQIPVHDRCRCSILPVTDLLDIEDMDYEEWFEGQEDNFKKEVLGPNRYQLYKDGMKITEFTNNGRKLTLDELYKKD